MSQGYLCYNNKFYSKDKAVFALNRAVKYGDGLFESIRVIDGRPKYLDFHFHRLQKGLSALRIDFSQSKWNEIKTCLTQLLIRNEIEQGGNIRLTLFRGGEGKYTPTANDLEYIIEANSLDQNNYQLNAKGLSIDTSDTPYQKDSFSNFKTLNALPYILASIEREEKGFDDLLLLNTEQNIVEATSSNVFMIFNQTVITPPLSDGCLEGVMRKVVISKLCSLGYNVKEQSLALNQLEEADEIFLTNSIKGVQWVGSYQKKRYFNRVAKQTIQLI